MAELLVEDSRTSSASQRPKSEFTCLFSPGAMPEREDQVRVRGDSMEIAWKELAFVTQLPLARGIAGLRKKILLGS